MKSARTILHIGDLHCPYEHPDAQHFVTALAKKYKPDLTVFAGDERDAHADSYHESDPDLAASGHELDAAIEHLQPFFKLFKYAEVSESNHGSLHKRKAKTAGLAKRYLKEYGDLYGAPKGWHWHDRLFVQSGPSLVCFAHSFKARISTAVAQSGVCLAQGHHHTELSVEYVNTLCGKVLWGMTSACLIDDKSPAFAYNKGQVKRPMLGSGLVQNGQARVLPMILDATGRWNGEVP